MNTKPIGVQERSDSVYICIYYNENSMRVLDNSTSAHTLIAGQSTNDYAPAPGTLLISSADWAVHVAKLQTLHTLLGID